jgi:hypothetical protein
VVDVANTYGVGRATLYRLQSAADNSRSPPLRRKAACRPAIGRPNRRNVNCWRGCEHCRPDLHRPCYRRLKQISEGVMSTKSVSSKLKQSNWYDDPRMTDEQRREAVKQFHDWCERKGLLPPQGS